MMHERNLGTSFADHLRTLRSAGASAADLSGWGPWHLPPDFPPLPKVRELSLAHNFHYRLSHELSVFPNVEVLDLTGSNLQEIGDQILDLYKLRVLRAGDNPLKYLPNDLHRLTRLEVLDLGGTGIVHLPEGLFRLKNLKELSLHSAAQASSAINAILRLTGLRKLDLRGTRLMSLPPSVGNMQSLEILLLSDNYLFSLPRDLTRLSKLRVLDIARNPLPFPPEISDRITDPEVILETFFTDVRVPLHEAKLILVGEGSVGKTSVARRLISDSYDAREHSTPGIAIDEWSINYDQNLTVKLRVWDFGGQEILHSTHQFFLTKRSLYLLITNTRNSSEQNRLDYWLRLIDSFGCGSPVVIVGNHSDEHPLDMDRRAIQRRYPMVRGFVETSCLTRAGIDELASVVRTEVRALPHIHDTLPPRWVKVKNQLEALDLDYMPIEQYVDVCDGLGVGEPASQRALLSVVNDLGVVLNFADDPRLQDTSILNPEWVTNGVYSIINSPHARQHHGVITFREIGKVLSADLRYPRATHGFILDMMRKFELCVPLSGPGERYLLPDLLDQQEPYTGDWLGALRFEYEYDVLPQSIMSRFIARVHSQVAGNTYWRSGVVMSGEDDARALVRAEWADRRIVVLVAASAHSRRRELLRDVRLTFERIHATIPGLKVEEFVIVEDSAGVHSRVSYRNLLDMEDLGYSCFLPPNSRDERPVGAVLEEYESMADRRVRESRRATPNVSEPGPETVMPLTDEVQFRRRVPVSMIGRHLATLGFVGLCVSFLAVLFSGPVVVIVGALTLLGTALVMVASLAEAGVIDENAFTKGLVAIVGRIREGKVDGPHL